MIGEVIVGVHLIQVGCAGNAQAVAVREQSESRWVREGAVIFCLRGRP